MKFFWIFFFVVVLARGIAAFTKLLTIYQIHHIEFTPPSVSPPSLLEQFPQVSFFHFIQYLHYMYHPHPFPTSFPIPLETTPPPTV
jgi:hypothetical protein